MNAGLNFLNEVAAEVRAMRDRDSRGTAPTGPVQTTIAPALQPVVSKPTAPMSESERLIRGVRSGDTLVGRLPPTPATVRGAVGKRFVEIVKRVLFWYTPPLQSFQQHVADTVDEHCQAIATLTETVRQIESDHRAALTAQAEFFFAQRSGLAAVCESLSTRVETLEQENERLRKQLDGVIQLATEQADTAADRIAKLELEYLKLHGLEAAVEVLTARLASQQDSTRSALDGVAVTIQNFGERLESQRGQCHTAALSAVAEARSLSSRLDSLQAQSLQQDHLIQGTRSKAEFLDRRVSMLFEDVRRKALPPDSLEKQSAGMDMITDPVYLAFENQFRGTEQDIKERLRIYLDKIQPLGLAPTQMDVLDIGCGRGEWLELLKESGIPARGVDVNATMAGECAKKGLTVACADVLQYLQGMPEDSLSAVTGFHIVEHLPFPDLVSLIDHVVRVLRPGGVAIFETPNPRNLQVGAHSFYMDPTHLKPLPSPLLQFLLETRGLHSVEVLPLHPYPDSFQIPDDSRVARVINEFIFSAQDYAVLGRKA